MAYTPSLADIPSASQNTAPIASTPTSSAGYTPTLTDIPQAPKETVLEKAGKIAEYPIAGVSGFRQGYLDAQGDMGTLARTLISHTIGKLAPTVVNQAASKAGDYISRKFNEFKDFTNSNPIDMEAKENHPITAAVGAGTGYVTGATQTGGLINKPIAAIASPLVNAAPMLTRSHTIREAASQGIQGAVLGAAANPEHPLEGGIKGGLAGIFLGGVTGNHVDNVKKMGATIQKDVQYALDAGLNPGSDSMIAKIQSDLKSQGINFRKMQIKEQLKTNINAELDKIRPDKYTPDQSPAEVLSQKAVANFPQVKAQKEALYAPLDNSTQTFAPTQFTTTLNNVGIKSLPKSVGLPDAALPKDATLNQMLDYRHSLDGKIQQAKMQFKAGKITQDAVQPYYQLRKAINQDIHDSAASIGMGEQLQKAEAFYNTQYKPFQMYNKDLNQLESDPMATSKAWSILNKQFKARNPNLVTIKNVTQTLGTEGQELVGWAKIEDNFRRSLSSIGRFDPAKLDANFAKDRASGLDKMLYTPEHMQAVEGIKKIADSGKQLLNQKPPKEVGATILNAIPKLIDHLIQSRGGISLLQAFGDANVKVPLKRAILNELIKQVPKLSAGAIEIGASKLGEPDQQQEQQQ